MAVAVRAHKCHSGDCAVSPQERRVRHDGDHLADHLAGSIAMTIGKRKGIEPVEQPAPKPMTLKQRRKLLKKAK